ncbi:proteophosphoglycan precursor [Pseudomonas sp. NZIPFR-PS5]|nr:proteophosphoglycan precursor [Pseudomonas sp. NZIPFR-PS5]
MARSGKGLPPVHLWNPDFCGDIDMRIARDGTWFYLGTPIGRKPMVRLFSTIIRRDGDDYFLITPVEKVGIKVDDAPFVGAEHPLRIDLDPQTQEPAPYIHVRNNLEALIHRNVFYQLVDLAVVREIDGQSWLGVWSGGEFFPIGLEP